MKKLFFALAAVLFAACATDVTEDVAIEIPETLEVSFEEGSRIQLQNGKTVWTEGDLVSVFYKSDANQKWQFQGETGDRSGVIKRVSVGNVTRTMDKVVVAYPYSENYLINLTTGDIEATLPATQHYLEGSYGLDGNIMVSSSYFTQVSLKNVCGWLKLQLTGSGEKVKSITVKGNNGEQVAGLIYVNTENATSILASEMGLVDDDENGVGANLFFDDAILTEVTLNCGEGVTLGAEPTAFYIGLPPQTFEKGFNVEVNCKGYEPMNISTSNVINIERNHILPMSSVAFEAEVRTIANNEIWYVATQKIDRVNKFWTSDTFGANVVSNEWDSLSGEGVIVFDDEVTKIGDNAFQSANITGITLPKSVKHIGTRAFEWTQSLSSIQIPANVESIGMLAFHKSAISEITFKTSKLTTIGDGAFLDCTELTWINIPLSVESIGNSVFRGCTKLKGINIDRPGAYWSAGLPDAPALLMHDYDTYTTTIVAYPAGATTQNVSCYVHPNVNVAWGAFWDCDYIVSVNLTFINSIEQMNFCYCDSLATINLDEVKHIANDVLSYSPSLKELLLPSIESIGSNTFCNNEQLEFISLSSDNINEVNTVANNNLNLKKIILGSGVAYITNSFNECDMLAEIYCKAAVPPVLANSFDSMVAPVIYVPAESVNSYKRAEGWKEFADCIVGYDFENGVVVPGQPNNEIWYTSSDEAVVEPDESDVFGATIVSNTYENGKGIITFDTPVTSIGRAAFFRCHSLTSVTIPDSVTSIGISAFKDCDSLTSITIPDGVAEIGGSAFYGCTSLKEVYCKPTTPPTGGELMFSYYKRSDHYDIGCKIYVPRASVDAYKAASRWSDYAADIEPYDF